MRDERGRAGRWTRNGRRATADGQARSGRCAVGRTDARQKEGSAQHARSPDVGRTDDARCCLHMGDWQTFTSTKGVIPTAPGKCTWFMGAGPWECVQTRILDR